MAIGIAPLADGQLPNSKTTLFTAVAATIIKSIILVNAGAGANLVNVYWKKNAGTSRRIFPMNLSMASAEKASWGGDDEIVVLDIGGVIEGDATNASEVDYVITGVTRT